MQKLKIIVTIIALMSGAKNAGMDTPKFYAMDSEEQRTLKFIAFGSNNNQQSSIGSYTFLKEYILKECNAPADANTLHDLAGMNTQENGVWITNNGENCKETVAFIMKLLHVTPELRN